MASWDEEENVPAKGGAWKNVEQDSSKFAGEDEEDVAESWDKEEEEDDKPKAPAKSAAKKPEPTPAAKATAKQAPPAKAVSKAAPSKAAPSKAASESFAAKQREQQAIEDADAAVLRELASGAKPAKKLEAKKPVVDDEDDDEEDEPLPSKPAAKGGALPSGPKKDVPKVIALPAFMKTAVEKMVVANDPAKTHDNIMQFLKAITDNMSADKVKKIRDGLTGIVLTKTQAETKSKSKGSKKPAARMGANDEYNDYDDEDYGY